MTGPNEWQMEMQTLKKCCSASACILESPECLSMNGVHTTASDRSENE